MTKETKEGETRIKDGYMQQFLRNKMTPGWGWRTIGMAPETFNLGNWPTHQTEKKIGVPSRHRLQKEHKIRMKTYRNKRYTKRNTIVGKKKKKPPPPLNINAFGGTRRKRKKTRRRTKRRKRNYSK
jgi:hypothetical protein